MKLSRLMLKNEPLICEELGRYLLLHTKLFLNIDHKLELGSQYVKYLFNFLHLENDNLFLPFFSATTLTCYLPILYTILKMFQCVAPFT